MIKFPVDVHDFDKIVTEKYFYINHTDYIPMIEDGSCTLTIVRPRGFGKSLLISILMFLLMACNNAPSPSQLVAQGNHAYYQNEYDAAFQAYAEASDMRPLAGEPIYNAANTFYRQAQYTTTHQLLSESLALSMENIEGEPNHDLTQYAHYNLGNAHFSQEGWAAAVEAYKKALRLRPDDMNAKYNLELALQRLEEEPPEDDQQDDQQSGEQQDQPEEQSQPEDQSAPEDQPQDNPPPEEQQEDESGQDQESGQEQAEEQAEEEQSGQSSEEGDGNEADQQQAAEQQQPQDGLSVEQARQLVGTVGENAETLQERLQQIYVAPNPPPDKDW